MVRSYPLKIKNINFNSFPLRPAINFLNTATYATFKINMFVILLTSITSFQNISIVFNTIGLNYFTNEEIPLQ